VVGHAEEPTPDAVAITAGSEGRGTLPKGFPGIAESILEHVTCPLGVVEHLGQKYAQRMLELSNHGGEIQRGI
jgi:hypothetical protein